MALPHYRPADKTAFFTKVGVKSLKSNVDKIATVSEKKSAVVGSKTYTSKNGKRVKLKEITKNGIVHLVLIDPIERKDYLEIEELVLSIRKEHKLFKGDNSQESYQFKFYKDESDYSKKSIPSIWSTYYNHWTGGKQGMDIIWGFSTRQTIIIHYPNRKIVKI
ncbi:MAG: hypothetical protein HRT73_02995 [Flavobacteriales bacterium]|nr:hypothetical protein [Flavobacteriales bacterium]